MTNVGEVTKKKPGAGMMRVGLLMGAVGLLLVIAALSSGGAPTLLVWVLLVVGVILAAAGYARRILAAVESR